MSSGNTQADRIIEVCEDKWDAWKNDCSGFVKAVANELNVVLTGNANGLVDFMESSGAWLSLGTDKKKAALLASQGYFVIAGLKASGHGHVAVIVSAPLGNANPTGYWGRYGSVGRKNKTINWSWSSADLPNVKYFAKQL